MLGWVRTIQVSHFTCTIFESHIKLCTAKVNISSYHLIGSKNCAAFAIEPSGVKMSAVYEDPDLGLEDNRRTFNLFWPVGSSSLAEGGSSLTLLSSFAINCMGLLAFVTVTCRSEKERSLKDCYIVLCFSNIRHSSIKKPYPKGKYYLKFMYKPSTQEQQLTYIKFILMLFPPFRHTP